MKEAMHAISFAFNEILRWHTMRYALMIGMLITILWVGIGTFFWNGITTLTSNLLELVPFSMIRSNGAWMLSTFMWFQIVLLTFALIYAFLGNFILKHVSKERYSAFSIVLLVLSGLFWAVVWFLNGDYIHAQLTQLLTWLPFETVEKSIAALFAFYLIYNAIIVTMLFVVSLFSEPYLKHIEESYFHDDKINKSNVFSSITYTVKDTLYFSIISLLVFPLIFIPFVNIVIQISLWMWLLKDTIQYDAASLVYEKVDAQQLKKHKTGVWFITFLSALFNFVPVLNFFGAYFGELAMFHYLKNTK